MDARQEKSPARRTVDDFARQPLLIAALAMAAGIVASRFWTPHVPSLLCLLAMLMAAWFVLARTERWLASTAMLFAAIAVSGALWHHWNFDIIAIRDIGRFASERSAPAFLQGIVATHPNYLPSGSEEEEHSRPGRTRFSLQVEGIRHDTNMIAASGRLEVFVTGHCNQFPVGERIQLAGMLSTVPEPGNPGQFDFASHFRGQGIDCRLSVNDPRAVSLSPDRRPLWLRLPGRFKSQLDNWIWKYVSAEQAPLASAMLLGNRDQLDHREREQFMLTGTVHLLAISGLHVGILAGLFLALPRTGLVSRRVSLLLTIGFVVGYAWLVGFRPPVVRAAILISVFCYCQWIGRGAFSFNSLALAALIVMLLNSSDLFSTGTQLSFLAVGSLVFAWRWLARPASTDPIDRLIVQTRPVHVRVAKSWGRKAVAAVLVSAVIWLVSLPLVAMRFHVVTPVALLVNPLVLVPMSVTLVSGFAVMVFGWAPPMATLAGKVCDGSLVVMTWLIESFGELPAAWYWTPGPPLWSVAVFHAIVLGAFVVRPRGVRLRTALLFLLVWMVAGWSLPAWLSHRAAQQRTTLSCTFIDVGHGSCVLLQMPGGVDVLYDCGSMGSARTSARNASDVLWDRGITRLDAVIVSHADADHYNGLPELARRFRIDRLIVSQVMDNGGHRSLDVAELIVAAGGRRPHKETVSSGDELALAKDVQVHVLGPPRNSPYRSDNANSIVLDIGYRGRRLLLTGDLEKEGLASLLQRAAVRFDLVMAPHHGSASSRPAELAAWSSARYVVATSRRGVNEQPRYGGELDDNGASEWLHTGRDGAIHLVIDNDGTMKVNTWRHSSRGDPLSDH